MWRHPLTSDLYAGRKAVIENNFWGGPKPPQKRYEQAALTSVCISSEPLSLSEVYLLYALALRV